MGVPITGTLTTYAGGTYPTHNDQLGWGGMRVVANYTARNAIDTLMSWLGMLVVSQSDDPGIIWQLTTYPPTGSNGDWTQFSGGSGGTITLTGDTTGTGTGTITTTTDSYNGGTPFGSMAAQNSSAVAITGGTITGIPDPTHPLDVANKEYVDTLAAGLTFVPPGCRVATTAALTATYSNGTAGVGATLTNSGSQAAIAIDGVTLSSADRVLVKNQAAPAQNGMYTVTTVGTGATNWVLTRATNYNVAADVVSGSYTAIGAGTTNIGTLWIMTAASVTTMGTDSIVFTPLVTTGAGTVTTVSVVTANGFAGTVATSSSTPAITMETTITGILKGNGTAISAATAGTDYLTTNQTITILGDATGSGTTSITLTFDTVNSNTGSFGSSTAIPSFTVNAKGLVTAASNNVVIAPAGTLTGTTLASNVVTSSLTTVGTIGTGTWEGTTIGVGYGGTGDTSLTAYAVMCGGTTSTGALQQVSGLGTSGYVLTSNGASALPTWQASSTGSGTVNNGTTPQVAYYASNGTAVTGIALSALIDDITSSTTQGSVLVRGPSSWVALAPSTANYVMITNGAAQNPSFASTNLQVDSHQGVITADSDGATITFNLATSDWHKVTLGGNRTLALSNPTVGQQFTLILIQDGTGSRTVTWFTTIKWPGGTAPTLTTTAGGIDVFTFKCVSSGQYYGFTPGQAMA